MAHKKGGGSTRNGRDSNAQRLGVKRYDGEWVHSGTIIIRQRGTRVRPGLNVGLAKDDTLFALADGFVKFEPYSKEKKQVSVYPSKSSRTSANTNFANLSRRDDLRLKSDSGPERL